MSTSSEHQYYLDQHPKPQHNSPPQNRYYDYASSNPRHYTLDHNGERVYEDSPPSFDESENDA